MMECCVDVFVGNSTFVDSEIYQLWVDGNSAREAADVLQQRGILQQFSANMELLMSDVLDHYRTFHMLERLLHTPLKLTEEWTFQMESETQKVLIEKYYYGPFFKVIKSYDKSLFSPDTMNWMTQLCGKYLVRSFRQDSGKIWMKSVRKHQCH